MSQCIEEQIRPLPAIESEGHFFAVGLEMFRRDFMPRSYNATLQERESGFDCVGVSVALHVDMEFVPDGLVPSILAEMLSCAPIGVEVIREKHFDIFTDIFADELFKCTALYVRRMEEAQIAAALPDADDVLFVLPARCFALPAIHAADEGFIHLYLAVQERLAGLCHGRTDAVAEIPSRLVADSKRPLNLAGAHAFLRLTEQVCSCKPLFEGQVSVIENRPSSHGELIAA